MANIHGGQVGAHHWQISIFLHVKCATDYTSVLMTWLQDYPIMGELGELGRVIVMRCVFCSTTKSFVETLTPNVMVFGDEDSGR